ncbi:NADH-quinone oxidoreductase subunit NuoH [Heliobacterium gestii]|uniref:NADH-quinone oxidoreductase subunit H n=1 Tax=Heliomicrobium gestii TaxID=2699 RepID=A0A845LD80_HELGE|nr:NADH-quinone oxidoreductase subunit NuoH [Heliomicrobium gestii]MBM7867074.1 NADH-quinone oxidoreductase subunit H [Heliomicrobium gestii]MZP43511.1 NADH-quinone oxidoreductase subunit NuoH [Heliomicrobium gestii]
MTDQNIFMTISAFLRSLLGPLLGNDLTDMTMYGVGLLGVIIFIFTNAVVLVLMERKVAAFMQSRLGPNRVGPWGLLQTVADTLKLLVKEDYKPREVDTWVWALGPALLFIPAIGAYAVIPFDYQAVPVDLNIGIFYFIALSSLSTLPFLMAGWGSNNKYSLIGGMRSVAQMISYEVPLIFSLIGVIMLVGSMQMSSIVEAQHRIWFVFLQPVAFLIYVIAATAETNRTPFDLVECEGEIIAGPFTEYSGMRWAMFFLAEYANLVAVSAIATTLFLGGWQPLPLPGALGDLMAFIPGWAWFAAKTYFMIFIFMWFRWTFPRFRVDQLMAFGWKVLIPLSLANILVTGVGIYLYRMAIGG